jgi:hypothetical protein
MTMTPDDAHDQTAPPVQSPPVESNMTEPIIARPGKYYRNTRYIMTVVLIGMGLWFGYDGFVGWPKLNERIAEMDKQIRATSDPTERSRLQQERQKLGDPKTAWDIGLQKFLCFVLPPIGIIVLIRALHNSRGEYRLEGNTLHVPGHPPVPFENITEIDKAKWDRKGIAYVHYDLGGGQQGKLRLDDFHYDRPPTDEIYNRIERYVNPSAASSAAEETKSSGEEQGA